MKRMMALLLLLFTFVPAVFAKEVGGSAAGIWSFGAGARSVGVGNASVGLADDATASYWNPARLSYVTRMNFNFLHAGLFEGAVYDYMGFAYPTLGKGTFGSTLVRLNVGGVERRDRNNNLTGSYSFTTTGWGFSYGNALTPNISVGTSVKYLQRALAGINSSLMSVDLAGDYKLARHTQLGLVVRDVSYAAVGTDDELPLNAVLGVSQGLFGDTVRLVGQMEQRGPVFRGGFEYNLGPAALRMGMSQQQIAAGGFGMKFRNMQFDYAFVPHELGNTSRFSMGMWFGGNRNTQRRELAQDFAEKARDAYQHGYYLRATKFLEKALDFSPRDATLLSRKERLSTVVRALKLKNEELRRPSKTSSDQEKAQFVFMAKQVGSFIEAPEELPFNPSADAEDKLSDAERYFLVGHFALAAKAAEDAVRLNPTSARAHERLGSSYYSLGFRELAIEHWRKSLDLNPNNAPLRAFMQKIGVSK